MDYLSLARAFVARDEKDERDEQRPPGEDLSSSNSFSSLPGDQESAPSIGTRAGGATIAAGIRGAGARSIACWVTEGSPLPPLRPCFACGDPRIGDGTPCRTCHPPAGLPPPGAGSSPLGRPPLGGSLAGALAALDAPEAFADTLARIETRAALPDASATMRQLAHDWREIAAARVVVARLTAQAAEAQQPDE